MAEAIASVAVAAAADSAADDVAEKLHQELDWNKPVVSCRSYLDFDFKLMKSNAKFFIVNISFHSKLITVLLRKVFKLFVLQTEAAIHAGEAAIGVGGGRSSSSVGFSSCLILNLLNLTQPLICGRFLIRTGCVFT